jgi:hypothetical protein
MPVLSQVLVLLSDTANDGRTLISVPKHFQTPQETRFDWSQVSSWGLAAEGEAHRYRSGSKSGLVTSWVVSLAT